MGRRRRRGEALKQREVVEEVVVQPPEEATDPRPRFGVEEPGLFKLAESVYAIPPAMLPRHEDLLRDILEGTIDCLTKVPAAGALFTPSSIIQMILSGEFILWRVKDDHVDGYVMTTVRAFPRARVLEAPFVFGKGLTKETFERFLGVFMDYGKQQGCSYFKGYGRKGWQRAGEAPTGWLEVREFLTEIPDAVQDEGTATVH